MLSQPEAIRYLLGLGLLQAGDVVQDTVTVANVSRRHLNWRVTTQNGPGYLLKQGVGGERAAALEREAAIYRLLNAEPAHAFVVFNDGHAIPDLSREAILSWMDRWLKHDGKPLGGWDGPRSAAR